MTNREWLNSLSDEDFAKWCCREEIILLSLPPKPDEPSPRLETIKRTYMDSCEGLKDWLKEERK